MNGNTGLSETAKKAVLYDSLRNGIEHCIAKAKEIGCPYVTLDVLEYAVSVFSMEDLDRRLKEKEGME